MILESARQADRGLDLLGIQDHLYQRRFLDAFALMATLTANTSHLRVFPDVACLPLRHPAMLANESASIDLMSGGRFELGLGAGAFWNAIAGMGGPRRSPGEALAALDEAAEVIRLLWSGERGVDYEGAHYKINGIHSGPVPVHDIEIWFGVYGPKACELLGRVADGWIPSLGRSSIEELDSRHEIIDESASNSGRDPAEIRRLINIGGKVTDGESNGFLDGPQDQWVDQLARLVLTHGYDSFIFWPQDDPVAQIRRFTSVAKDVHHLVESERS